MDGGFEAWNADGDTGVVLWERLVYDNTTTANAVDIQMGATDTGALVHFTSGPTDAEGNLTSVLADVQVQPDGTIVVTSGKGTP